MPLNHSGPSLKRFGILLTFLLSASLVQAQQPAPAATETPVVAPQAGATTAPTASESSATSPRVVTQPDASAPPAATAAPVSPANPNSEASPPAPEAVAAPSAQAPVSDAANLPSAVQPADAAATGGEAAQSPTDPLASEVDAVPADTVTDVPPMKAMPHDLSPEGMFMAADWVVKSVMISLAVASVLTWTVWLAKSLQLFGARARAKRGLKAVTNARQLRDALQALENRGGVVATMVRAAQHEVSLSDAAIDQVGGEGVKERVGSALARIEARMARGEPIPGFGHRLYPDGDIRAEALLRQFEVPSEYAALARAAAEVVGEAPNVDFALAAITARFALPAGAPTTLFALSRSVGWLAHMLEQAASATPIRPRARYTGPAPGRA